jgi:hypothetical protein
MGYLYEACDQISDFCHQNLLRKMRRKMSILLLRLLYNGEGTLVVTPYCCVLCCVCLCRVLCVPYVPIVSGLLLGSGCSPLKWATWTLQQTRDNRNIRHTEHMTKTNTTKHRKLKRWATWTFQQTRDVCCVCLMLPLSLVCCWVQVAHLFSFLCFVVFVFHKPHWKQTMIYKTLHRTLNIEQHKPH